MVQNLQGSGVEYISSGEVGETLPRSRLRRVLITSIVGTVIEWYDFVLFAVASGLVFNKLFFPALSPTAGTMASYLTLAVGFVARPLGGLIISHFGDRVGRRPALVFTIVLMGAATVGIGLLPTYGQVGILAPILLLLLRLLQGLGAGAEYAGAVILVAEYVPERRKGYYTAYVLASTVLGLLLGSLVFRGIAQLPEEAILSWAWRLPFLLSAVLFVVALYIRNSLEETPEYIAAIAHAKQNRSEGAVPIKVLLKEQRRTLFLGFLSMCGPNALTYTLNTFALSYMINTLKFPSSTALNIVILASITGAIFTPIMGALSDRVGYARTYLLGNLFILLYAFPLFWLIDTGNVVLAAIAMMIGYGLGFGSVAGAQGAFLTNLFPTRYRFSGIAFVREMNGATVAGMTPFIAAWLTIQAGGRSDYLVIYLIVLCALSTGAIWSLRKVSAGTNA